MEQRRLLGVLRWQDETVRGHGCRMRPSWGGRAAQAAAAAPGERELGWAERRGWERERQGGNPRGGIGCEGDRAASPEVRPVRSLT